MRYKKPNENNNTIWTGSKVERGILYIFNARRSLLTNSLSALLDELVSLPRERWILNFNYTNGDDLSPRPLSTRAEMTLGLKKFYFYHILREIISFCVFLDFSPLILKLFSKGGNNKTQYFLFIPGKAQLLELSPFRRWFSIQMRCTKRNTKKVDLFLPERLHPDARPVKSISEAFFLFSLLSLPLSPSVQLRPPERTAIILTEKGRLLGIRRFECGRNIRCSFEYFILRFTHARACVKTECLLSLLCV